MNKLIHDYVRAGQRSKSSRSQPALTATDLLSGRPATTHWRFADAFNERFPDVRLDTDKMVIEDGDIITAGGLRAWTDLGLRLVDWLMGSTVMAETGSFMLIDSAGREQRHYSRFAPRLTHGDEAILKVQHWLQAREAKAISVGEMARVVAMEEPPSSGASRPQPA